MTTTRIKFVLANWLLALIAVFLLAGGLESLFTNDRAVIVGEYSAELNSCRERFGENVAVVELPNGSSVCTDKRGRRIKSAIVVAEKVSK